MDDKEQRCNKDEGKLDWLSDASQERCQGSRDQNASRDFGETCLVHHCQRCCGQTEHHHREEARLEESRAWIVRRKVTLKITMYSMIITKLEPDVAVDDVMQTQRDQQAIQKAVDTRSQRSKRDDRSSKRVNPDLNWLPDVAEADAQHNSRKTRTDRYKAPPTEEAQIIREANGVIATIQTRSYKAHQNAREHIHIVIVCALAKRNKIVKDRSKYEETN